jgi:nucleotide-binding universal stress UspA family protein
MKIKIAKILCPVDFSPSSDHALEYACAFAEAYQAELKLIHVFEASVSPYSYSELELPNPELMQNLQEDFRQRLENLAGRARERCPQVYHEMLFGKPFTEIIAAAREWHADVIVMGTHGRTGIEHLLIGSVAEKVVRKSPCPVLTVRHPEHDFVMP